MKPRVLGSGCLNAEVEALERNPLASPSAGLLLAPASTFYNPEGSTLYRSLDLASRSRLLKSRLYRYRIKTRQRAAHATHARLRRSRRGCEPRSIGPNRLASDGSPPDGDCPSNCK